MHRLVSTVFPTSSTLMILYAFRFVTQGLIHCCQGIGCFIPCTRDSCNSTESCLGELCDSFIYFFGWTVITSITVSCSLHWEESARLFLQSSQSKTFGSHSSWHYHSNPSPRQRGRSDCVARLHRQKLTNASHCLELELTGHQALWRACMKQWPKHSWQIHFVISYS